MSYDEAKQALPTSRSPGPEGQTRPEAGEIEDDGHNPEGPPNRLERKFPQQLLPAIQRLQAIISVESIALDLCLERCIEIVEFNYSRRASGIDNFPDSTPGARVMNTAEKVALATPMAVRLYDEVLKSFDEMNKVGQAEKPKSPTLIEP